ncbi:hypothetical protein [Streptomyces achromogenes]
MSRPSLPQALGTLGRYAERIAEQGEAVRPLDPPVRGTIRRRSGSGA